MTEIVWQAPALALVLAYLLGSIPFGVVLTRAGGAGDVRAIGSGNIGATNVLRTGRKGLAAATLLLDGAKGTAAVLLAGAIAGAPALGAIGAFFGHVFPVWLRFRGGKGVATLLGVLAGLSWPTALAAAGVWLAALAVTRISSVGGIALAIAAPVLAALFGRFDLVLLLLGLALMVLWTHRENIGRLIDGGEPGVGGGA